MLLLRTCCCHLKTNLFWTLPVRMYCCSAKIRLTLGFGSKITVDQKKKKKDYWLK